jgi:hypothetical protein
MRYAKNLSIIALVIFFITGMAGLSLAAQQSSQMPSTSVPQSTPAGTPAGFPDLRMTDVNAENTTNPGAPPSPGDQVRIRCGFLVCGCFQKTSFTNRADIDGVLLNEKEAVWVPVGNTLPDCQGGCRSNAFSGGIWTATSGSHTITCILDSKNNIGEGPQNELNNTKSIAVNVPLPQIDKIKDIKTKQPMPIPVPGVR